MTEEGEKERTDREMVVPWLKFLWETYRAVLDILKTNTKLEHVYHATCIKAFNFCRCVGWLVGWSGLVVDVVDAFCELVFCWREGFWFTSLVDGSVDLVVRINVAWCAPRLWVVPIMKALVHVFLGLVTSP